MSFFLLLFFFKKRHAKPLRSSTLLFEIKHVVYKYTRLSLGAATNVA